MAMRKEDRVKKKYMVNLSDEGVDALALTQDLSKGGMNISAEVELPARREITLSIAVPGEIFQVKGEVMWCKDSGEKDDSIPESIGIKIVEAPAEYLNFVEFLRHQSIPPGKPEF